MYEPVRTTYFVGGSLYVITVCVYGFLEPKPIAVDCPELSTGGSADTAETNPSAHSIPKAALFVDFIPQFPTIPGQRKLAPVLV